MFWFLFFNFLFFVCLSKLLQSIRIHVILFVLLLFMGSYKISMYICGCVFCCITNNHKLWKEMMKMLKLRTIVGNCRTECKLHSLNMLFQNISWKFIHYSTRLSGKLIRFRKWVSLVNSTRKLNITICGNISFQILQQKYNIFALKLNQFNVVSCKQKRINCNQREWANIFK